LLANYCRSDSKWVSEIPQINVLGVDAPTLAQLDEDAKAKLAEFRQIVQVRIANSHLISFISAGSSSL
jgi:hypothetical protein